LYKKISVLAIALFLSVSFAFLISQPGFALYQSIPIKNKDTIYVDDIGEPETVDPHWAYDTASAQLIFNVYDTLVFFNRERIEDDTTAFELHVADSYTISGDGLTYTFHIRENVPWQAPMAGDSIYVEPEDVQYSFWRGMLMNHDPTWMLTQPLLGCMYIWDESKYDLTDPTSALQCVNDIQNAVTVSGRDVTFHLASPYAPLMQILSQTWADIMDQEWTSQYTWDGTWPTTGADAVTLFADYTYPATSPIDDAGNVMMGCGPYKLVAWTVGLNWRIERFDAYYLGWPAAGAASSAKYAQVNLVPAWATRKLRFLAGDADLTGVPRANIADVILGEGVRGTMDLPTLSADAIFFNYAIPSNARWKPTLGGVENLTLLSDINLRKAFANAINYAQLCQDAFLGEAQQVANPIIQGVAYYDPTDPAPVYDLTAAENYLKAAWGGELWSQGFTLPVVYNTGNLPRQTASLMLEQGIESIGGAHGTFNIQVTPASWSLIIPELYGDRLPAFTIGWIADFADPHNWLTPFMHPFGDFSGHTHVQYGQSTHKQMDWSYLPGNPTFGTAGAALDNDYIIALIEEGVKQLADVDRNAIYRELAKIYYDERPNVMSVQATGRHWEQDWLQGWYYNPIGPGGMAQYFYHMWKSLNTDMTGDGKVYQEDVAILNAWWWDGTQSGSLGSYNRVADLGRPLLNAHTKNSARDYAPEDLAPPGPQVTDNKADTQDMDALQYVTGISGGAVPNIWDLSGGYIAAYGDGFVDIYDKARINAEWNDVAV